MSAARRPGAVGSGKGAAATAAGGGPPAPAGAGAAAGSPALAAAIPVAPAGGDIAQRIGATSCPAPRSLKERPCIRLSVDLLATYKHINDMFYANKRKQHARLKTGSDKIYNDGFDDENGNYVVQIGEEIAGRFIVQDILGKGSFGIVLRAHDHRRDENVALKVIKNKPQFTAQAKVEIDILTKLAGLAKEEHNIVRLKKYFPWKNHLCLAFELLSFNLYDLIKYTKFNGVSLNLIRKFAYQVLRTLEFLCSPELQIIHCDVKPENILLKNPKRSSIKVIDFGSSCYTHKLMFKYIQSRFYRAPEVILGHRYNCAIDMWSLGCVLVELHTGLPIFDGKDEPDQLLKMHQVIGPLPASAIEPASQKKRGMYLTESGGQMVLNSIAEGATPTPRPLSDILGVNKGGPSGRRAGQPGHGPEEYRSFCDLIEKILTYEPEKRITPTAALQHPFVVVHADAVAAAEADARDPGAAAAGGPARHVDPGEGMPAG
eukprot:TRINITY_DN326_c0_g1_i1.p1 TRINITY_DN326_c0_g1~~TRINITY_DN326_c0_g1_i1.p1  ORF type:complete len:488 (+),score=138.58 TRINITY_DN326_c0_g1_i1:158-1621(+)